MDLCVHVCMNPRSRCDTYVEVSVVHVRAAGAARTTSRPSKAAAVLLLGAGGGDANGKRQRRLQTWRTE
eukprot:COSAG05_NODE_10747_length_548_cov_1.109131_2_plen_68_part_01